MPISPDPADSPGRSPGDFWVRLAVVLLVTYVVLIVLTARDYGITWDEEWHATYGEMVIAWYRSGFRDRAAVEYWMLIYYGALFDVLANAVSRISPLGLYETRHLVNAAFGVLGAVYTFRLASFLGGHRAGFIATLTLLLVPAYYGHAFNNPKDLPFAVLSLVSLYYLIRSIGFFPHVPWGLVFRFGIATGLTLGVRFGGMLLFLYLAAAFAGWLALGGRTAEAASSLRDDVASFGGRFLAALVGAWLVMLVWWPAAQARPLAHPVETWRMIGRFDWNQPVLFRGRDVLAPDLPWFYLPQWLLLTIPEFIMASLALGAVAVGVRAARAQHGPPPLRILEHAVLLVAAIFPPAYAMAKEATVYDGLRHFLFIIPPLAILSGLAFEAILGYAPRRAALGAAGIIAAGMIATAADMAILHPHQYLYFNRIFAGGLRGAAPLYETDYWGNSYREGVEWVVDRYGDTPSPRRIRVTSCSHPLSTRYFLPRDRFEYVRIHQGDVDVALGTTRWRCHETLPGRVVHTIDRQGVPLLYITETSGFTVGRHASVPNGLPILHGSNDD